MPLLTIFVLLYSISRNPGTEAGVAHRGVKGWRAGHPAVARVRTPLDGVPRRAGESLLSAPKAADLPTLDGLKEIIEPQ